LVNFFSQFVVAGALLREKRITPLYGYFQGRVIQFLDALPAFTLHGLGPR
jgi:hypothetical protein